MLASLFQNKLALWVVSLFILVFGVIQLLELPIALYPRTSKPTVRAYLSTSGMSKDTFFQTYGENIEQSLKALKGVEKLEATYSNGSVNYKTYFDWNVDPDKAKQDVSLVLRGKEGSFPKAWGSFWISFEGQYESRFFYGLQAKDPTLDLEAFVADKLEPQLHGIEGIADVWKTSWSYEQIELVPKFDRFLSHGVPYQDALSQLRQISETPILANLQSESMATSFVIHEKKEFLDLRQIEEMHLLKKDKALFRVGDLFDVSLEAKDSDDVYKVDGESSVLVGGYATPDANIKKVADSFYAILDREVKASFGDKVLIKELVSPSPFIEDAILNVFWAVIAAIIIASLVVWLFLQDLWTTFVICVTIPLSLLTGFILMRLFSVEINLISLSAMALAVGMSVDGSIVMLEYLSKKTGQETDVHTVVRAVKRLAAPIAVSILTTVIVFLPLPFTSPLASAVLGDLAIVISFVLLVSLIVSLTVVPTLFLNRKQNQSSSQTIFRWPEQGLIAIQKFYRHYLIKMMHQKKYLGGFCLIVTGLFAGSLYLLTFHVERDLMKRPSTDKLFVVFDFNDPYISYEEREKYILTAKDKIFSLVGEEISFYTSNLSKENAHGELMLFLKSKKAFEKVKNTLEESIVSTPIVQTHIWPWIPSKLELPEPYAIKGRVVSQQVDEAQKNLAYVAEEISKIKGVGNQHYQPSPHQTEQHNLTLKPEFYLAENSAFSLSEALLFYQGENYITDLELDGKNTSIIVKQPDFRLKEIDAFLNLPVLVEPDQKIIPIRAFADLSTTKGLAEIFSLNGERSYEFSATPGGNADRLKLEKELEQAIRAKVPPSAVVFDNPMQEINETLYSLTLALLISCCLILGLLSFQFGNLKDIFIVFSAIPLGLIGCGFALYIFDAPLGINSMLGMILLGGIAVNNSILLLDFYRHSKAATLQERVLDAVEIRMRPILMTTLTTSLGMIPLAIGMGSGGEVLRPLGIAVTFGLWISSFFTLFVVPLLLFYKERRAHA